VSYKRPQKHRPDTTAPAIVEELENRGYIVEKIGRPVDLLVRHPSWPLNTWRLLECKSPSGKAGTLKLRADQEEQQKFCAEHGVPYVMSGFEALAALGVVVSI
jgi:hypothetical protein